MLRTATYTKQVKKDEHGKYAYSDNVTNTRLRDIRIINIVTGAQLHPLRRRCGAVDAYLKNLIHPERGIARGACKRRQQATQRASAQLGCDAQLIKRGPNCWCITPSTPGNSITGPRQRFPCARVGSCSSYIQRVSIRRNYRAVSSRRCAPRQ